MADFCKQCSVYMWGKDTMDLAYLRGLAPTLQPDHGYSVICEGCGFILVNDEGECIDCDLLKTKHQPRGNVA